jgi:uncharacterized protein (DUF433 family)
MSTVLGNGVYSYQEAALLTGLRRERVGEWFRTRPEKSGRHPIFRSDYEPVGGDRAISFLDLIDVFVAGRLREHGVSLQTLRRVYARLQKELQTAHPFGRRELLSDGKTVFTRGMDEEGQEELREVLSRQKVFPDIIQPFLKKIDYSEISQLARRWHVARLVVIDPHICFGKPVVEPVSIPTAILAAAYRANQEDAERVAGWYDVHADHVLAAVEFENSLAA